MVLNPSQEHFGCNCRVKGEYPLKPTMNTKDILVFRKHHSKKDSRTIPEKSTSKV